MPPYSPATHVRDLTDHSYFDVLISLRHMVQMTSHSFFASRYDARVMDLYMWTPTISSPLGPGSDSEPIVVEIGGLRTNLIDSAQFGFEPLLVQTGGLLYCYLPSMRGEDPDPRHLNQFFHCECELVGTLPDALEIAESYFALLCEVLGALRAAVTAVSCDPDGSHRALERAAAGQFPRVDFDDAVRLLEAAPKGEMYVEETASGRDITPLGEQALVGALKIDTPFWVTGHDRDRVPFYQQPTGNDGDKVLSADLVTPAVNARAFGGEVVGCGQRQDNPQEMYTSLERQGVDPDPFEWYIDLRRHPRYRPTSGFGLGVERFLAWALARPNIRDVILYPRIKGVKTYP